MWLAAVRLLEEGLAQLALAGGQVSLAGLGQRRLGADTDLATPAGSEESVGLEAVLLHGTSNDNPMVERRNFDTGFEFGDFYFVEAGNRLLLHSSI